MGGNSHGVPNSMRKQVLNASVSSFWRFCAAGVLSQPSDTDSALPSALIADPTALQTMVTVSAEGIYILQLEGFGP